MNDKTARPSNEAITGATRDYTVAAGHSLRAGGRNYTEGQVVPLQDADAKRLLESGAILAGDVKAEQGEQLASGTAQEVIASLEGLNAEQLDAVEAAENAREKPRKTVLEAIEAARADLAEADPAGDGNTGDQE